jgi:hypothetical protein
VSSGRMEGMVALPERVVWRCSRQARSAAGVERSMAGASRRTCRMKASPSRLVGNRPHSRALKVRVMDAAGRLWEGAGAPLACPGPQLSQRGGLVGGERREQVGQVPCQEAVARGAKGDGPADGSTASRVRGWRAGRAWWSRV